MLLMIENKFYNKFLNKINPKFFINKRIRTDISSVNYISICKAEQKNKLCVFKYHFFIHCDQLFIICFKNSFLYLKQNFSHHKITSNSSVTNSHLPINAIINCLQRLFILSISQTRNISS